MRRIWNKRSGTPHNEPFPWTHRVDLKLGQRVFLTTRYVEEFILSNREQRLGCDRRTLSDRDKDVRSAPSLYL